MQKILHPTYMRILKHYRTQLSVTTALRSAFVTLVTPVHVNVNLGLNEAEYNYKKKKRRRANTL